MNERLTVFTDHALLYTMLSIDYPSGRLIRWILHLAEFDLEFKYKKWKINTQGDSLSGINVTPEAIPHDDNDSIHIFESDFFNVEIYHKETFNETDLIDIRYCRYGEVCGFMDHRAKSHTNREPTGVFKLLHSHLRDRFSPNISCTLIERRLKSMTNIFLFGVETKV